ncbi:energy-coupling factor transporter transmembrane component T [Pseudarthrobacter cellobiosi]|uniref:energy-coupling factor transporter transmembrane component T n=1 Tax=Pseudarthrobacter cellobiosi TaxID=2953654 RepID=UPI00208F4933|nr:MULTISPECIES: energy-coupling factor transporter transmembrane component T [unclassified Pseudarthrobacter]MCO4256541.1 energy-coupling factor transporter transmembrane protein EcfT [Pseudarthrobacter sp. HLT1-5]MCO4276164.1 energy-coupling factor transporter transmembrane protein EcfT [Pseudarthrobacter sp. HLT3-5]
MRLHPLTSLAAAGSTAVITTAAGSWPLSVAVIAAAAGLSVAGGVARRMLPVVAVILVPLVLSLLALHGLFFPEGITVLVQWGPARVTAEGLHFAFERAAQLSAAVLVLLLWSFTVSVPDLVAALSTRGVHARFAFVLASTLTLLPAISSRLGRIRQAQEARGLVIRPGIVGRAGAFRWQAVPLVLALVEEAGTRAAALQARGFGSSGPNTSYREVQNSRVQRCVRVVLLLAAVAAIAARLWQPTAGAY